MLSGVKGTGKTVMAKVIAKNSKLPVIVVDTEDLLGWLDGVQTNAKKLVLFTCNNEDRVNEYLKDRCSRVRYTRHFEANDNARFLKEILKDKGIANEEIDPTYNFIVNNFNLLSIDNILSFIDEKLMFPELSNEHILKDMNISTDSDLKINKESINNEINEEDNNEENDDEYDDEYDEDEMMGMLLSSEILLN